jgi:hypothetical protein
MVVQALDQVGDAFRSYFDDLALIEQLLTEDDPNHHGANADHPAHP